MSHAPPDPSPGSTGVKRIPCHDHTIVVPDLRGMGLSSRPPGGYDKKTQGRDIAGLLDTLEIKRADLVTHDIGNMVGYSFSPEPSDLP